MGLVRWQRSDNTADAAAEAYRAQVAAAALELGEDYLRFPEAVLLPLTLRAPGPLEAQRPWARLRAEAFFVGAPLAYSLAIRREPPDLLRGSLRARRTLLEGVLLALAEKTGRRPSQAELAADAALDAAESALALGRPVYRVALLAALFAPGDRLQQAEGARRTLEARLRAQGLVPQRLYYLAERALAHLQPGGELFPGTDTPALFAEEVVRLLPAPARQVMPAPDAVWIGRHARDGWDVYFSPSAGLDPASPPPPHALTLILGEMGAGKTTLLRWILLQRLLQGRSVVSLDPEGENNRLCQALGGRVIPASPPADPQLCLVHPLQADTAGEMLLAVRFLVTALADAAVLTPGVSAALHEAVQRRWARRPGALSLAELGEALAALAAADAAVPLALLRPYMRGGLLDGFFDRPRALVSADLPAGTWWNFDLSALRQETKALVHAVLAWFLYRAVTVGRQPMDIYIDEGWRLLRPGAFTELLDELGRRARKRGIVVTLSTHLPQDLLRATTSLSLAATAFIGRLGPEEALGLFRALGVSEAEARRGAEAVARLPPRVFLAAPAGGRGALFPVQVSVPQAWLELFSVVSQQTGSPRTSGD